MLRVQDGGIVRTARRRDCAQIPARQVAPKGEDGAGDQTAPPPQAQVRGGVHLLLPRRAFCLHHARNVLQEVDDGASQAARSNNRARSQILHAADMRGHRLPTQREKHYSPRSQGNKTLSVLVITRPDKTRV